MRAAVMFGLQDVRVVDRPDPKIHKPSDAVVKIVAACVCGSDLWSYRGIGASDEPRARGH